MKYDNNSLYFKDWTTKKLKEEAISYEELIYGVECYSTRDILAFSGVLSELEERGIEYKSKIIF